MITLPAARVGPYIRALRAGVRALAPDVDHVPAGAMATHLEALDPAVSGPLLLPATVDPRSGLPALAWMDRVRAERAAAREVRRASRSRVEAIRRTDPELADRLLGRIQVLEHVGDQPLVPELAVSASLVRRGEGRRASGRRVRAVLDRRLPGAGWTRIRVEIDEPPTGGPVVARVGPDGQVALQPGFSELLARHVVSPLGGLLGVLREVVQVRIHRLSRGVLGPFWFPGGPHPPVAPDWSDGALVLHASVEVIGAEVRSAAHHDPFAPPLEGLPGQGGAFRGRRLAVSPHKVDAARRWAVERVGAADVVPLTP